MTDEYSAYLHERAVQIQMLAANIKSSLDDELKAGTITKEEQKTVYKALALITDGVFEII